MTLPDKLYVVRLKDFRPEVAADTPYGMVQAAETDCHWLNQDTTPKQWLGESFCEAAELAKAYYARTLRAPGFVSAGLLSAAFNPRRDTIPTVLFESGRTTIHSAKRPT